MFDVKHATVSEHITNILASGELDETSVGFSDKSSVGRKPNIYNLDMILSVGYRVNSKRGIAFRKWANNVLKQYIMKGYAINEKRLQALEKIIDIQSRKLYTPLHVDIIALNTAFVELPRKLVILPAEIKFVIYLKKLFITSLASISILNVWLIQCTTVFVMSESTPAYCGRLLIRLNRLAAICGTTIEIITTKIATTIA